MVGNLALAILIGVLSGSISIIFYVIFWRRRHIPRVLESLPDAVFLLDQDDQITAFNPAAQSLLINIPIQIGMHLHDLIPQIAPVLTEPQGIEIKRLDIMFGAENYELRSAPLRVSSNQISGRLITMHNITRLRSVEQEQWEQERKRQSDMRRIKDNFVRMAAHDLKSPIAVILGYAELAMGDLRDNNTNNIMVMLQAISQGAQQMDRLIMDLLDLTKIEAGMPLKLEKVNVDLLVKEAVSNFRLSAQKKQINLSHNVPEQDIKLMLDRNRILQVVNNLVSNAVKYTPEGGSVSAGYEYLPAEQQVRICIRDSGLGIPPEALPHLFEPFYRIDGRHHNLADGSGLGLAIARAIVEQHHGGIQVESEADNGTTFTITLPAL